MKFLFISYSNESGGSEKVMRVLSSYFQSRNIHSLIMSIVKSEEGRDIIDVDLSLSNKRLFFSNDVKSSILKIAPTHVFVSLASVFVLLTLLFPSKMPFRLIYRESQYYTSEYFNLKNRFIYKLRSLFLYRANIIIAQSRDIEDEIISVSSALRGKTHLIYNPSFMCHFNARFRRSDDLNILSVGRLTVQKNFKVAPDLLRLLKATVSWDIYGEGELRKDLELQFIGTPIILKGYSTSLSQQLNHYDCMVVLSLWEGLSNSIIQALNNGLVVFALKCPGGMTDFSISKNFYLFNNLAEMAAFINGDWDYCHDDVDYNNLFNNSMILENYYKLCTSV